MCCLMLRLLHHWGPGAQVLERPTGSMHPLLLLTRPCGRLLVFSPATRPGTPAAATATFGRLLMCPHPAPRNCNFLVFFTSQVGDCFIYNNAAWRLNYCVGGEVTTLYHLDR